MDESAKCSVTNNANIVSNVTWYDKKNKPTVHMSGDISDQLIVPDAEGLLQI